MICRRISLLQFESQIREEVLSAEREFFGTLARVKSSTNWTSVSLVSRTKI